MQRIKNILKWEERDLFQVYLNICIFHFVQLHINKKKAFAFSYITDMFPVLPNRQDGNEKHEHYTTVLNTSPTHLTDFKR